MTFWGEKMGTNCRLTCQSRSMFSVFLVFTIVLEDTRLSHQENKWETSEISHASIETIHEKSVSASRFRSMLSSDLLFEISDSAFITFEIESFLNRNSISASRRSGLIVAKQSFVFLQRDRKFSFNIYTICGDFGRAIDSLQSRLFRILHCRHACLKTP